MKRPNALVAQYIYSTYFVGRLQGTVRTEKVLFIVVQEELSGVCSYKTWYVGTRMFKDKAGE